MAEPHNPSASTSKRNIVRRQLRQAWKSVINQYYNKQLINSEHGLQAYLALALMNEFGPDSARRIFVEPRLTLKGGKDPHIPDLLICNRDRIIAVVELKYGPCALPAWKKDFATLTWLYHNRKNLQVRNNRYLGPGKPTKSFPLATNAVLCWAAIHRSVKEIPAPPERLPTEFYLGLHALTSANEQPKVICQ